MISATARLVYSAKWEARPGEPLLADQHPCPESPVPDSLLADSPGSLALTPAAPGAGLLGPSHSYSSSPLSLFRLQEQFRQHMAATSNLVHYSSFEVGGPAPTAAAAVPYLGVNVAHWAHCTASRTTSRCPRPPLPTRACGGPRCCLRPPQAWRLPQLP